MADAPLKKLESKNTSNKAGQTDLHYTKYYHKAQQQRLNRFERIVKNTVQSLGDFRREPRRQKKNVLNLSPVGPGQDLDGCPSSNRIMSILLFSLF